MMMKMHHHRIELDGCSGGLIAVQSWLRAHPSLEEVEGFHMSPHMPWSAEYSAHKAPAAATVATGGQKKRAEPKVLSSLLRKRVCSPLHREPRGNLKRRPERARAELSRTILFASKDRVEGGHRSPFRSSLKIGRIYAPIPGVLLNHSDSATI